MKYFVFITLSFLIFSNINAQYSREEAIHFVKDELIAPDSLTEVELYSKYNIAIQGDTIILEYFIDSFINPYEEAWVFFIDDMPEFMWGHPIRIIFFNVISGEYTIHQGLNPPIPYFEDHRLFWDQWEWIIYIELSRAEAINIVIDEVIGANSLENKHLYSRYEEFMYDDTLWMFQHDYYHLFGQYKGWAFFIDDAPLAYWAHSCRVVFVFVYGGFTYIYEDEWPPDPWLGSFNLFLEQWEWITTVDIPENDLPSPNFDLFPNPCKEEISIQCKSGLNTSSDIFISDLTGKTVKQIANENLSGTTKINTSKFKNGLYFINVFENRKLIYREKED